MSTTEQQILGSGPPRFRWFAAGIWLVYLGSLAGRLLGDASGWQQAVGLTALAIFVVLYLVAVTWPRAFRTEPVRRRELLGRWAYIGGMLACSALMIPGGGDDALTSLVFVTAAAMGTLPLRQGWGVLVVLFIVTEASGRLVDGWSEGGNGFAIVLAGLAVWGFRMAFLRQRRLLEAERELREHALEEERTRIARDLHDILGHSLTVISVKTELAERMLDVDPARTRAELLDLARLSRDALADVRSTAAGLRGVSLPGEIASAREALESAAIDAELPTVADEVPSRWRELFAWTVREAVTNVVRHSAAQRCTVRLTPHSVTIADDGIGVGEVSTEGRGLIGLRERTRLAGGTLSTGPGPSGAGFSVRVEVPE
ncbi:sensor histidine kinase [Solicola gregarius]|uniref:Sensor histidine kinase n=1 Tax=Solicola gregarius TaxID=2908642 RepID=A0AA46TI37_9ACTN|nr:sensor histidine kinase [Solicola gregarius]UYM05767.1 sensor histidine kinase [Solicola gregarius]